MSRCKAPRPMHELLVDYHYGELDEDRRIAVRLHLATCPACPDELAAIEALTGALKRDEAFPGEAGVNWDGFARLTVMRAVQSAGVPDREAGLPGGAHLAPRRGLPEIVAGWIDSIRMAPAPAPSWAAAAASLVAVVALAVVSYNLLPIGGPEPERRAEVMMPDRMLDNLTVSLARQNTAEYLKETRAVLVTLLDVNIDCDKGKVDISAEKAKAFELLRRQRLIAGELHRYPLARAQDVCDDLEKLLFEVASLADCTHDEEIQTLRDVVEKKQILVRMELLSQELARREGAHV